MRRLAAILALMPLAMAAAPARRSLAVFAVTSAANSGAGTLRDAITMANAAVGADTIDFNIPGPGVPSIALLSALPNITDAVVIDGTTQPGAALVELNGAGAGAGVHGLTITAAGVTVRGLVINRFGGEGIAIEADNAVIQGNRIGTDAAGTSALGNGNNGIVVRFDAANALIGGTGAGQGNLISGNSRAGIDVSADAAFVKPDSTTIHGNLIGTNAAGTAALGNALWGIVIGESSGTIVGGAATAARNVICGSGLAGIQFASNVVANSIIRGNYVGVDATGSAALPNQIGVITDAFQVTIGGSAAGEGNVISGNTFDGLILGGRSTTAQGNRIGTNPAGTAAIANGRHGVVIRGSFVTLGGIPAGSENIISGNGGRGVRLEEAGNTLQYNFIGTNAAGTGAIPNAQGGLHIVAGPNTITGAGGNTLISGNTGPGVEVSNGAGDLTLTSLKVGISATGFGFVGNSAEGILILDGSDILIQGGNVGNNGAAGVRVVTGTRVNIQASSIYNNGGLGIELGAIGVTPNDPFDSDLGANNLLNFPILTRVINPGVDTTVQGRLDAAPNLGVTVRLYETFPADPSGSGEGEIFKGSVSGTTDQNGVFQFSTTIPIVFPPNFVTAVTIDQFGNTSEFSPARVSSTDATLPTVDITQPTTASTFTSGTAPFILGGTAADDVSVAGVTWSHALGWSGAATLAAGQWTATVPLVVGPNVLTVTAVDGTGNTATDSITVDFAPAGPGGTIVIKEEEKLCGALGVEALLLLALLRRTPAPNGSRR